MWSARCRAQAEFPAGQPRWGASGDGALDRTKNAVAQERGGARMRGDFTRGLMDSRKSNQSLDRLPTLGYPPKSIYGRDKFPKGAVAQLGERMTGSHEVRGSIPLGSTNSPNNLEHR
jgi:hypothetical protein